MRGIPADTENNLLVQTMLEMTTRLERETVAEGVETVTEAMRLQELGFRAVQGYLFARPMPNQEFNQLVAQGQRYVVHHQAAHSPDS